MHNLRLCIGKCSFQIASFKIDGQEILFIVNADHRAQVLTSLKSLCRGLQQRKRQRICPRELDVANVNGRPTDGVNKGSDWSILRGVTQIVRLSLKIVLRNQSLQRVGNLIGKIARDRQLSIEERYTRLQLLQQFLIREPDKIVEPRRDELSRICQLKLQLCAFG